MSLKYLICFIYKVTRLRLCRLGELNALYKRVKYCNMPTVWKKTFSLAVCSIGQR